MTLHLAAGRPGERLRLLCDRGQRLDHSHPEVIADHSITCPECVAAFVPGSGLKVVGVLVDKLDPNDVRESMWFACEAESYATFCSAALEAKRQAIAAQAGTTPPEAA